MEREGKMRNMVRAIPVRKVVYIPLCAGVIFVVHWLVPQCGDRGTSKDGSPYFMVAPKRWLDSGDGMESHGYPYHRGMPLIFIGGVPRSGTTLMRAMLDAHPEIRCGQETRVIPRLLQMRTHWLNSQKESLRLEEAGLYKEVIDSAIAAFSLEVIAKHGEPAPRLCNKDPLTLKSATYLAELFPASKFILMVRDGRATVHSIISRKVTITGFDLTSYRQCLTKWNSAITAMHNQCKEVGPERCLVVHYEQLVLHPHSVMQSILNFLDVPWDDTVLHHEKLINKRGGVKLSKVERSSDQVIQPVNFDPLAKWVGHIPGDVVSDMPHLAPMLSVLGYDPRANPPAYGVPDPIVLNNTRRIRKEEGMWRGKAQDILGRGNATDTGKVLNDKEESAGEAPSAKDGG